MTRYKFSEMGKWRAKTKQKRNLILRQSTNDIIQLASKTAAGVSRGGSIKKGFVPRDTGNLAASLLTSLKGSTSLFQTGGAYSLAVGNMVGGDVISFRWTANYARRLHYGFVGTDSKGRTYNQEGWFWIDEAIAQWDRVVARNAAFVNGVLR